MMIGLIKKVTTFLRGDERASSLDFLNSIERMRGILDRERMRADRGNTMFTLVTFTCAETVETEYLTTLGRIAQERVRTTDDVGMLGPHCIGLVLPETSAGGAWRVADDICSKLPTNKPRPQCDVYVHPAGRITSSDDQQQPSNRQNGERTNHDEAELARSGADDEDPRVAQAIQFFFEQPMPSWKRVIDIVVSATALVVLSPLLLLTAIAIKLTSSGPILFSQPRGGLGGRLFQIYKFRTMCVDAEEKKKALLKHSDITGPAFKMEKDPRITRLGGFLRKTCIDELPQLINIVLGDMSLVGPRPLCVDEIERCLPWHQRRLDVTPGLTCIWQVSDRTKVSYDDRTRMDVRYIESRSLIKDAKLIAQTLPAVMLRKGAC
jgi:lipopolysaccharide/colanic/teichoic acid biosynthesis glycosyltransferase